MEFSTILPLTQLSCFMPKTCTIIRPLPFKLRKQRNSKPTHVRCQKMYVPGFGEASPEKKAAKNMHNFFTYIAVRIIGAQLEVPAYIFAQVAGSTLASGTLRLIFGSSEFIVASAKVRREKRENIKNGENPLEKGVRRYNLDPNLEDQAVSY